MGPVIIAPDHDPAPFRFLYANQSFTLMSRAGGPGADSQFGPSAKGRGTVYLNANRLLRLLGRKEVRLSEARSKAPTA